MTKKGAREVSDQDSKSADSEANSSPDGEDTSVGSGERAPIEGEIVEESASEVEPTLEELVSQLQDDVLAARDAALRSQADAQNVKRRAEQDVEKARKFALERFSGDLLPVVDNLERSLEAASGGDDLSKSISEGVELTLKSLMDLLKKYNIEAVNPEGEPFDPQLHQAMTMLENLDMEPNTVMGVMQKGYTLNGRLLRPAMVMVSKAPD
ncbi:MAG: molecular chaperone GrpE [Halioglobus sp.]|jgi:molecular chaperone GrpE